MQPSGRPRLELELFDLSVLVDTGLKGIHAVTGPTEWGPVVDTQVKRNAVLVGSVLEYTREFGGLLSTTDFPLLCRRALEAGAKLLISRAAHYTDATDATTIVGVRATGTITASANVQTWKAKSIGAWGNKVTVTVAAAANGAANEFDVTIELAGYDQYTQTVRNVVQTPTTDQIATLNGLLKYADLFTLAGNITAGTVTLTTGAQVVGSIVAADYIGDGGAGTGIHAFDSENMMTKICVPHLADPLIDDALISYVEARKDLIALTRTPVGLDGAGCIDYRHRSGAYTGVDQDSWRAALTTGGLSVIDPRNLLQKDITELADVLGCMSRRDNRSKEWFSAAGPKRGRISNSLGVIVNFGSPGRATEADLLDIHGINTVIDHENFGPVFWGNSTLWKSDTMLKHLNVAELTNFILRGLKPISQLELFDPNDIETWRSIFRRVSAFMDVIKAGRGIWDYKYEGDQDVDKIEDATVNTSGNIDAGQYIFRLFYKPKAALKYIGIQAAVTNSNVNFQVLQNDFVL